MAKYEIKESDVQEIIKCMEGVAVNLRAAEDKKQKEQDKEENISSMEIAQMFKYQHIKVFNMITKFITTEATESEKAEFQFAKRTYNRNRSHEVFPGRKPCGYCQVYPGCWPQVQPQRGAKRRFHRMHCIWQRGRVCRKLPALGNQSYCYRQDTDREQHQ